MEWIHETEKLRLKLLHAQAVFSKVMFSTIAFVEILSLRFDNSSPEQTLAATLVVGALSHIPAHMYRKKIHRHFGVQNTLTLKENQRIAQTALHALFPKASQYHGQHYIRIENEKFCTEACAAKFSHEGDTLLNGTLLVISEKEGAFKPNTKHVHSAHGKHILLLEKESLHLSENLNTPISASTEVLKLISKLS